MTKVSSLPTDHAPTLELFERIVLAAVHSLDEAYGVNIRRTVEQAYGKRVLFGRLYLTLTLLEHRGYLTSSISDPRPERGSRARRCYRLDSNGKAALANGGRV